MNIQEAKEEITHTLRAYLHKDAMGSYTFPLVRQRPILLIGPPGIGKTAVMELIRQGMPGGACQLYDDASHTAECDRTAEARREKLRGNEADSDGIYDE